MIYLTGDIHGGIDIHKLASKHFDRTNMTRDDYVVILGDFGLVWNWPPSKEEKFWLHWLEDAPWTTLVVLGNHENYPLVRSNYEAVPWHGGHVRPICKHVLQLVDNEIFDIDGKTFFVRGGAHSIDRHLRIQNKTWWREEVPTEKEREAAFEKLRSVDWKVDYVLSHDAPLDALFALYTRMNQAPFGDEYERWLQKLANNLEFERWFFGHHHQDMALGKFNAVYNTVVELDGMASGRMKLPARRW